MRDPAQFMNYNCPHCSTLLPVTPDETEITCPCCLTVLEVSPFIAQTTPTPPATAPPALASPPTTAATIPEPVPDGSSNATKDYGRLMVFVVISTIIACTFYLSSKISNLEYRTIYEIKQLSRPVEYEYEVKFIPDQSGISVSLWLYSKSGWELVSARRANDSENEKWGYECILRKKRQASD